MPVRCFIHFTLLFEFLGWFFGFVFDIFGVLVPGRERELIYHRTKLREKGKTPKRTFCSCLLVHEIQSGFPLLTPIAGSSLVFIIKISLIFHPPVFHPPNYVFLYRDFLSTDSLSHTPDCFLRTPSPDLNIQFFFTGTKTPRNLKSYDSISTPLKSIRFSILTIRSFHIYHAVIC